MSNDDDTGLMERPAPAHGQESIGALVRRLVDEMVYLVRSEFRLARSEMRASAISASGSLAAMAVGAMLISVALFCLLAGVVAWLAQSVGVVAAAFIVAGVSAVFGGVLIAVGIARLKSIDFAPARAVANLKRSAETFKGD